MRQEIERHLAVEKETQEVELKAARERQAALKDLEHGVSSPVTVFKAKML